MLESRINSIFLSIAKLRYCFLQSQVCETNLNLKKIIIKECEILDLFDKDHKLKRIFFLSTFKCSKNISNLKQKPAWQFKYEEFSIKKKKKEINNK